MGAVKIGVLTRDCAGGLRKSQRRCRDVGQQRAEFDAEREGDGESGGECEREDPRADPRQVEMDLQATLVRIRLSKRTKRLYCCYFVSGAVCYELCLSTKYQNENHT